MYIYLYLNTYEYTCVCVCVYIYRCTYVCECHPRLLTRSLTPKANSKFTDGCVCVRVSLCVSEFESE